MSLSNTRLSVFVQRAVCRRCAIRCLPTNPRYISTSEAPPPLLSKLKNDLKTAMRAKDTSRLNVLRAIISETNQAASGPSPIKTDLQVLALLRKRKSASQAAAKEAEEAKRNDLKEKQEKEIDILDEYAGTVQTMPADELQKVVTQVVESHDASDKASLKPGIIMKELLRPGGPLDGKPVEKAQLAKIVQTTLAST